MRVCVCGAYYKPPDFFCTGIKNCRRLLKIHCYYYTSYEMTVHCSWRRLLRRGLEFHVCTINKLCSYEKSLHKNILNFQA